MTRSILFSYTNYPLLLDRLASEGVKLDQHQLIRHGSFTFDLQGVSRAASHQIVRHRVASFSQQCYDAETEVLTAQGWKHYDELSQGQTVATLNPTNFKIEYQPWSSIFVYSYNGPMHCFKAKQVDLCVTPNHRLFVKVLGRDDWEFLEASQVAAIRHGCIEFKKDGVWQGNGGPDHLVIPGAQIIKQYSSGQNVVQRQDTIVNYRDFVEFLGYFLSEGCVCAGSGSNERYQWTKHVIELSQKSGEKAELIGSCVERLPFHTSRNLDRHGYLRWRIEDKSLFEFLKPLGKAHEKYIPRWALDRDTEDLHVLFNALITGDGSIDPKTGWTRYYTTSRHLADDVQELAFRLGYSANILRVDSDSRKAWRPCYSVSIIRERNTPLVRFNGSTGSYHTVRVYSGAVWCIEVPNHTIYVRRNGKPVWCGNSQRYVKVTRSYGYLKPPSIPAELRVPVAIQGQKLELSFADVMDLTRQVEEGYTMRGLKAEDGRYVRPNAATTNIVMSMSPRQLLHFFNLRCAADAQWEIRDLAWAMYASVRLAAPGLFNCLPVAEHSDYVEKRVMLVDQLVERSKKLFDNTPPGDLFTVELEPTLGLTHPVETLIRRY